LDVGARCPVADLVDRRLALQHAVQDPVLGEHRVDVDRPDVRDGGATRILVECLLTAVGDRLLEDLVVPADLLPEHGLDGHESLLANRMSDQPPHHAPERWMPREASTTGPAPDAPPETGRCRATDRALHGRARRTRGRMDAAARAPIDSGRAPAGAARRSSRKVPS